MPQWSSSGCVVPNNPFPLYQPDKEQNQEQAAVEQEEQKEWEVHKCKLDEFASSASQVQRRKATEAE